MYTDIGCCQRDVPVQYVEDLTVANPFRPYFPKLTLNQEALVYPERM